MAEEEAHDTTYSPMSTSSPSTADELERSQHAEAFPASSTPAVSEVIASACFAGLCFLVHVVSPHKRGIPYQYLQNSQEYVLNLTNNEEFDEDTIPDWALVIIAALFPALVQLLVCQFVLHRGWYETLCCYFIASGLNNLATESIKLYVGYLRPSFYQLCAPDDEYQDCTSSDPEDAHKSFPSGHASQAFCGMMLLSLFFQHSFGVQSVKGVDRRRRSHRLASILSVLPIGLALFVAASRVRDNKHFPADVVAGSLLGSSVALYVFGIYF